MPTSGDLVDLDLGLRQGREAGFPHLTVIVTAQRVLDESPAVVQIVPLTTTLRDFGSEIQIEPDPRNGLEEVSAAQCQHIRAVSTGRIKSTRGNVGPVILAQIRQTLAMILELPV